MYHARRFSFSLTVLSGVKMAP